MTTRIKICGVTRPGDIALCENLGVEYIGFNFVPSSPRCLTLDEAARLRERVVASRVVGIFADQDPAFVREVAARCSLEYAQLHGNESVAFVRSLSCPVIKAFRSVPSAEILEEYLEVCDAILLDGATNGERLDTESAAALPQSIRSHAFLAGGLHSGNVADAILRIRPLAVDVASGVESSPGIKDPTRMKAFVESVRSLTSAS